MSGVLCFARAFLAKDPNSPRPRKTPLSGCPGEVGNGRSPAGRADHQKLWLRRGYRAGGALVLALLLLPTAGESLAQVPTTIELSLSTTTVGVDAPGTDSFSVNESIGDVVFAITAAFPAGSQAIDASAEEPAGANDVSVQITVGSTGTSSAVGDGEDFTATPASFTLTIPEEMITSSATTFTLMVAGDDIFEPDETLQVVGSLPGGETFTFSPNLWTITILDDDPDTITLSLSTASVAEGDVETVTVTAVPTSGTASNDRVVEITVADGTATTGTDFTAVPATITLTIPANMPSGTASFTLTAIDDELDEPNGETLQVVGTSTTSFIFAGPVELTITDEAPDMIDLSLSTDRVTEGDDPVTVMVTAVVSGTASNDREVAITVAPSTEANAAQAEDFTAVPSFTLTIASETLTGTASFELTVTDDTEVESEETLEVAGTLTSFEPVASATLTIADNDGRPPAPVPVPVVETLLPELGRIYAASVIDAVSGRIEAVASGGLSSSVGHSSLAHRLAANQQNLNDGDLLSLLEESPLAFELGGTGAAGSGGGQAASPSPFGLWASGDYDRLASKSDELGPWDGRQFTLHAGMDTEISRNALVGVAGSWSKSNFVFDDNTTLETDADLMGLNLYVGGHSGDGKRNVWATVGYGRGDLEVDGMNLKTDLKTKMLAVGASNNITARPGFDLDIKGEISTAQTSSDAVIGTPAVQSRVHRMRAALKIGSTHIYDSGSYLTRSAEGGFRLERGDGDIGSGFEIDGALDWSAPALGVTATGAANVLLLHSGYLQRSMGVTGRINYAPPHAKGRGLTLRAQPSYGRTESDAGQLWGQEVADLESEDDADPGARLVLNAGWGLPAQSGRDLVTPYSGLELSEGGSRVYRLGSRVEIDSALSINLVGNRKEEGDSPEHGIDLHLRMQW